MITRQQVTDVINKFTNSYLEEVNSVKDINCGLCENFAMEVLWELCGYTPDSDLTPEQIAHINSTMPKEIYGIWMNELDPMFSGCTHYIIVLEENGKEIYFDVECPEGVEDPKLLPFWVNR